MAIETAPLPARLDGVQVLRGLAAGAVAWHHALEVSLGMGYRVAPPEWLVLLGAAGVDIFFVISGFIMVFVCARGGAGAPYPPGRFLLGRIRRIYPLYWVCCAVFLAAMALGFFAEKHLSSDHALAGIFLWPVSPTLVDVSWTLSYEMYFYLVFAAGLLFRDIRMSVAFTAAAITLLIPASILFGGWDAFAANPLVLEFAFGMILGLAFVSGRFRAQGYGSPLVLFAGIAALTVASILFYAGETAGLPSNVRFLAWGLPSVLIVLYGLNVRLAKNRFSRGAIALGDASYSTYLFHTMVLIVYAKVYELFPQLFFLSQWILVPVITIACLVAGWMVHRLIERNLLRIVRTRRRAVLAGS